MANFLSSLIDTQRGWQLYKPFSTGNFTRTSLGGFTLDWHDSFIIMYEAWLYFRSDAYYSRHLRYK